MTATDAFLDADWATSASTANKDNTAPIIVCFFCGKFLDQISSPQQDTGHFFHAWTSSSLFFPNVMCAYIIKVRSGMVVILHLPLSITRCDTLYLHTDFMASAKTKSRCAPIKNTCCVWAGGTNANYPDFCENHQFHVIYCITLMCVLYFEKFLTHDSHWFTIFKEWLSESVGPVPFSTKYQIRMDKKPCCTYWFKFEMNWIELNREEMDRLHADRNKSFKKGALPHHHLWFVSPWVEAFLEQHPQIPQPLTGVSFRLGDALFWRHSSEFVG
jgi:hypothetical protein